MEKREWDKIQPKTSVSSVSKQTQNEQYANFFIFSFTDYGWNKKIKQYSRCKTWYENDYTIGQKRTITGGKEQ